MPKTVPRYLKPQGPQKRGLAAGEPINATGFALSTPVLSGVLVTPQTALCLTAVYACINVIATDFAKLSRGVYRRTESHVKAPYTRHRAHDLIRVAPNKEQNAFRFFQALMGHVLGWGNGFAEIVFNETTGFPEALHLLNPATTKPKRDERKRLYYELDNGRATLPPERVFHLAGLGFDGLVGYSPVTLARQAVGLGQAAEQFGAALFGNGAIPKGVLKTKKRLSDTAKANLRESVYRVHQGTNQAHGLMILEEDLDWVNTQISPEDAQFLLTRAFQVLEICRMFRVPPHKVMDFSEAHLANLEESNQEYLDDTLLGWVLAFEAEGNLKLLSKFDRSRDVFISCDMENLMRANLAARTTFYQFGRNGGVLSSDDIRTREGINPIGAALGGDKYVIQGQYTELRNVGRPTAVLVDVPGPAPAEPAEPDESVDPTAPEPPEEGDDE